MLQWGQTHYLAQVLLLPRPCSCSAILLNNVYYITLTLVTLLLWSVEGILYLQTVCITRQYNISLLC